MQLPLFNLASKAHTTGSALTPLLWAVATLSTFTIVLYGIKAGWPAHVALGLDAVVIIYLLYVYNHLLRTDPDRLHSEAHIQQMRSYDVLGDNVHGSVAIEGSIVGNPHLEHADEHR